MSSKYEELIKYVKQTEALSHASGLIAWDQETKMPKGSVEQRADTLSVLESEIHKRKTNKYIELFTSKIFKTLKSTALCFLWVRTEAVDVKIVMKNAVPTAKCIV